MLGLWGIHYTGAAQSFGPLHLVSDNGMNPEQKTLDEIQTVHLPGLVFGNGPHVGLEEKSLDENLAKTLGNFVAVALYHHKKKTDH